MQKATLDLSQPNNKHADERLRQDLMLWIGTTRPDGRPHLVPVWFLWDGQTILVFSKPDQKIRNLRQNKNVMLSLDDTHDGSDVVLIEGEAELLTHADVAASAPAYAEKYAKKLASNHWTLDSMAADYSEVIRITPTKFRAYS
ncbi:MAG: pyridoxamine 5'-phosphate oxidase family protein [Chloroflexia bacterium]